MIIHRSSRTVASKSARPLLTRLLDQVSMVGSNNSRQQQKLYASSWSHAQQVRNQGPPPFCRHILFQPNQNQHQYQQCRTMAGHNKWSKIRHKKAANDKNRVKIFSKAAKAIIAASRACNGDTSNLRLQSAIAHAKAVQLPKDRIEDSIAKGSSSGDSKNTAADLETIRFDAMMEFGSSKVACIIKALTDNRNRTVQNVRYIITKSGGELLPTDKLSYIFVQVGLILVDNVVEKEETNDDDDLFECALDAGAINIEQNDDDSADDNDTLDANQDDDNREINPNRGRKSYTITTDEKDLWHVVSSLQDAGYDVSQFEHRYVLQDQEHGYVDLTKEGIEALDQFLEKLDENEDVTNVYHNALP